MQNQCQDNFSTTFTTYGEMQLYHEQLAKDSPWQRCKVSDLHVEPMDRKSPLFSDMSAFALGTSSEAVADTAKNLGLAISVEGQMYPVRGTHVRLKSRTPNGCSRSCGIRFCSQDCCHR